MPQHGSTSTYPSAVSTETTRLGISSTAAPVDPSLIDSNTVPAVPQQMQPDWTELPELGVLFNFLMKFKTGGYGTPEDFKRKMREIRRGLANVYRCDGYDPRHIDAMVQKQLDVSEIL